MLMMTLGRQRVAGCGNNLAATPITFIDPRVGRDCAGLVGATKFRIGQVRQKMEVPVLCHLAPAR
jgi:hypothetical protein